jgi:hypothetical protein
VSRLGLTAVVVAIAIGSLSPVASASIGATSASTIWNPVQDQDFPDPSVILYDGTYYAYSTGRYDDGENIQGATSTDGLTWTSLPTDLLPLLPSWATRDFTWAPSVSINAEGEFVMYFAALDTATGRECIGRAVSATPGGPYSSDDPVPVVCQTSLGGDIDPSIFSDQDGQSYLLFKNDGNSTGQKTALWSEPLDAELLPSGSPTSLMSDDETWQDGIVERPAMIEESGAYYLFYSGGSFESAGYGIGYATCAGPSGPCEDRSTTPILNSGSAMSGPGSPSFFTGATGQLVMAFTAWPSAIGYTRGGIRAMYEATVSFVDGVPTVTPQNGSDSPHQGYWEVGADGGVFSFGNATFYGSTAGMKLKSPIVGMAASPDGHGYWLVAADGGVFSFGDAQYYGSMGGRRLDRSIVGMAVTGDGRGYWLVASDGGVFAFGDAQFHGSTASRVLRAPVTGMAADPTTGGYWLVASDGGVFGFDAPFFGSMGGKHLAASVRAIAAAPDADGYWLVAADGGVFAFGDAPFEGSPIDILSPRPLIGMAAASNGKGYWLATVDGGVDNEGWTADLGSMAGHALAARIVAVTST